MASVGSVRHEIKSFNNLQSVDDRHLAATEKEKSKTTGKNVKKKHKVLRSVKKEISPSAPTQFWPDEQNDTDTKEIVPKPTRKKQVLVNIVEHDSLMSSQSWAQKAAQKTNVTKTLTEKPKSPKKGLKKHNIRPKRASPVASSTPKRIKSPGLNSSAKKKAKPIPKKRIYPSFDEESLRFKSNKEPIYIFHDSEKTVTKQLTISPVDHLDIKPRRATPELHTSFNLPPLTANITDAIQNKFPFAKLNKWWNLSVGSFYENNLWVNPQRSMDMTASALKLMQASEEKDKTIPVVPSVRICKETAVKLPSLRRLSVKSTSGNLDKFIRLNAQRTLNEARRSYHERNAAKSTKEARGDKSHGAARGDSSKQHTLEKRSHGEDTEKKLAI